MNKDFTHIHVHSHFSIGDGISSPKDLVERARAIGQKSLALTDHGSAAGLFEFWKECKENEIKALCGVEAYLAHNVKIEDEEGKVHKDTTYHCVLLVKNEQGYKDLCKLIYKSNKETYYYRPVILFDDLFSINSGNLIATSACVGGIINRVFHQGSSEEAYDIAKRFKNFFGDDFYIEVQLNELDFQHSCNEKSIQLAKDLDIKTIVTNDVHYAKSELVTAQDVLKLIIRKTTINDIEKDSEKSPYSSVRKNFLCERNDFFLFNKEFGYNYDDAFLNRCLDTTNEIADKCCFNFDLETKRFPKIVVPSEYKSVETYFKKTCYEGLESLIVKKKIPEEKREEYKKRLDYEIKVICDAGFADYFLIYKDIFDFCRFQSIYMGVGRGSAAGSLISYVLGITRIDPIVFNLMFERFQNPSRAAETIPDIDSDSESDRKIEIEEFLKQKYGEDSVLHVATFNEFHMKGVIRDIVRVFNIDPDPLKGASKAFDEDLPPKYKKIADYLRDLESKDPSVYSLLHSERGEKILEFSDKLYKKLRYMGKHAGGIVVFDGSAGNSIPTVRSHGEILTGFSEGTDKKHLSDLKILKLDILGLETLSVLKEAINLIKETKGIDLSEKIYDIDLADPILIETIKDYENSGIFQMESSGINKLCKNVQPTCFEDIVAISALYRPASLQGGNAFAFAEAKNDPTKKVKYPKIFEKYVSNTYGVIVYQEQVIACISEVLGINYGKADKWRKIFGAGFQTTWTKPIDFNNLPYERKERPKLNEFINEYEKKIVKTHSELSEEEKQETLFYLIKASGYSFNRSHVVCYSYCTAQTLFLKAYYPTEFYCSLLNRECDEAKIKKYLLSAKRKGIDILPFSITKSQFKNTTEKEKTIRLGFQIIKSFGDKAWQELKEHQEEVKDFQTFFAVKWSKLNKKCIESLALVGAFDEFGFSRKNTYEFVQAFLSNKKALKKEKKEESEIFSLLSKNVLDFSKREKSKIYKEVIGFDLSAIKNDALDKMKEVFARNNITQFCNYSDETPMVGGVIEDVIEKTTKKGKKFFELVINDGNETEKVRIWPWKSHLGEDFFFQDNSVIIIELEKDEKWGFSNRGLLKII